MCTAPTCLPKCATLPSPAYPFSVPCGKKIGVMLQFIGVLLVFMNKYGGFCALHTIGWVLFIPALLLLSTAKNIVLETNEMNRIVPAGVFVLCVVMSYIMGMAVKIGILVLIFEIPGWLCYYWYALVFIPDGRDAAWAAITICR
eukprot:TRINITY_DN7762_c0_g1_i5.p1 TRINITY_DN7762_c0_g1~~TRINITY_DN7762_c0_g1_i5.p1  ORF type:complete len:144 (+),score=23.02 TRINITY_DN7762_c0_g1_i5:138-569(+)